MPMLVDERVDCIVCHKEHTSMFNYLRFIHKECFKEQKQNRESRLVILKEASEHFDSEIQIFERKIYILALSSKFKDSKIFTDDVYPLIDDLKKFKEVKK